MSAHTYRRKARFVETDAAGIVHFHHVFCYAEEAEHDFFATKGHPLWSGDGPRSLRWPRAGCSAKYHAPIRYHDELEVQLDVALLSKSKIEWIWRVVHAGSKKLLADGTLTTICCKLENDTLKAATMPDDLWLDLSAVAKQVQ